jgi:Protein of unknown function (DUF3592)
MRRHLSIPTAFTLILALSPAGCGKPKYPAFEASLNLNVRDRKIVRTLIALALIVAGCGGVSLAIIETRRVLRQDNWRKVQGTVVDAQIVSTGDAMYAACVAYKYTVDGISFTGNVVKSGAVEYNWRGPAKRVLSRYPPGAEVTVFVDPSNAGNAVLEPGGSNIYPFFVVLSAITLVAGVAVLLT